jgi:hypothetical protein
MTVQPLVSPGEAFLAKDPNEVFLASGDPQRFLADNLPTVDEPKTPADHAVRDVALGIAAAFVGWRLLASRRLAELPPPTPRDEDLPLRFSRLMLPEWMALAVPVLREHLLSLGEASPAQAEAAAVAYAASLGSYLHQTSAEALVAGYTAELANGVSPELAWSRVAEGYGLTPHQMRGWLLAQRKVPQNYADQAVTDAARRALDKAVLQRADALGQTEAWGARQTGRSVVWMAKQEAGQLPETARKRWVTADDEFVCPVCAPLHKQEVGLRERFVLPNGASVWAPGVHPHCRCEIVLVRPSLLHRLLSKSEVAKVLPQTKERLQTAVVDGTMTSPGKRKVVATQVVVDELAARRQQRRLRQLNPNHPAVRSKLAKARGDDPYDRDAHGRFAADEMRTATLARPEPKTEAVTEPGTANPFAEAEVAAANPFAPAANPFAQANPFTEANPFVQAANPFVEAANPFAAPTTSTGTGAGQIIIFLNGKAERVPDDRVILAPVDWYLAAFNQGDETYATQYRYPAVEADSTRELTGLIDTDDIGKVIDFDEWHSEYSKMNDDKDLPGFPAQVIPTDRGQEPLVDFLAADLEESELASEEYHQYRAEFMESLAMGIHDEIGALEDHDLREIYMEAGLTDDARSLSTGQLRNGLATAADSDMEDFGEYELLDSFFEYLMRDFTDVQVGDAEEEMRVTSGYQRVPQAFSFTGGGFRQDYVGDGSTLRVYGKFRIAGIKTHSFTREALSRDPRTGEWRVKNAAALPELTHWQEIVLEPVDE